MLNEKEFNKIFAENLIYYMHSTNTSRAELAKLLNVSVTSVANWCNGLKTPRMDKVDRICEHFGIRRSDLMNEKNDSIKTAKNRGAIPVLGSIPAGTPLDAVQDIRGYIDVPISWVDDHGALIVHGDSMAPKYLDGDTVIFRIQPDCESGQDCVAYVNGYDATLKKVIKNGANIVLQPINPDYAPIVGNAENPITILGVVVELRRKV